MIKKTLSLILALVMIFSLCACGKTDDTRSVSKSEESKSSGAEQLAAEDDGFTYTAEYKMVSEGTDDYLSVLYYDDDGFYASYQVVVGERDHEGQEQTYEGEFDIYASKLVYVDYESGQTRTLDNYVPLDPPVAGDENQYDYYSSSYLSGLTISQSGEIYILEELYEFWFSQEGITYEDPDYWDYYEYSCQYWLSTIDSTGNKLSTIPIETTADEYLDSQLVIDGDGNFILSGSDAIRAIDKDGNDCYSIDFNGYCDSILTCSDGNVYTMIMSDEGFQKLYIIDGKNKQLVEKCDCPSDAYNLSSGGGDYMIYYNSGVTFYGIDTQTGESHKLFNWIDLDINGEGIYKAKVLSNGEIVTSASKYDIDDETFSVELYTLSKVPTSSLPVKQSITLATQYLSYEAREPIIEFNRKSDKYHIDIIDYSEYNTEEDYSAGLTKMKTEIMAGNVPDIIDLSSISVSQLASKGLIEDLYPYIDRDFDRSDFFENVLEACEINGKLYTTIPGFTISGLIGASAVVGDTPGWTYDQFYEALASMPEGCTALDSYTTRDQILSTCLSMDVNSFVNWETGEVNFSCDEFRSLLEFANSFPETFDWENYDYSDESTTSEKLLSGEQMLESFTFSSIDDVMYGTDFGSVPTTYVGYPTLSGTGNVINVSSGYAMSSSSQNKDAVWDFLKTFFTEDYQQDQSCLPIIKSMFNKKLEKAMTPTYVKDSSGNIVLDENGEKKMTPRLEIQNESGEWVKIYALSEDQGNAIKQLVETTNKKSNYDDSITSIVTEEAAAYFSGQKSLDEVVKLIQSKANIYVNEQR